MTAENRFRPYPLQSRWRNHLTRMLQRQVGDADKPGINVGRRLQELRQAQGLSQRVLAEMSGLNFNTLSLIENEKTSPNVSTLQQLAEALNVPVMAFFEPSKERRRVVFQKASERPRTVFSQGTFEDLGGGLALGQGTPLLMSLLPNQECKAPAIVHTGEEFVFCLSGRLIFWVDEVEYPLEPGDSLIFEAHIPHRWANLCDDPAQAILVICPADQDDRSVMQHLQEGLTTGQSQIIS